MRGAGYLASLAISTGALAVCTWGSSLGCSGGGGDQGLGSMPAPTSTGNEPGKDAGSTTVADGGTPTSPDGAPNPQPGVDSGPSTCTTNTGPISGTVSASGGSISRLVFAVAGDTRPTDEDKPSEYPTAIITKIFQDIEALSPRPPLIIGTGDYQFSSTGSDSTSAEQVGYYMQARTAYSGAFFPAMGNHECGVSGSFTTSDNNDCGPGNPGGTTPNYSNFMSQMLGPISQKNPYYSINVDAADKSWTAKFVVTAANAWDAAQQTWLEGVMAQPTTYTFVIRHEASDATPPLPTGVAGVDAVIAQHPYTLLIVGHAHTYGHYSDSPQVVILGNGGAPLSSKDYGYGLFSQRCDGAIVGDEIDYMSGATDSEFHFVITPQGTITK